MKNCSIIVFNYESVGFLRLCIAYIRKHTNPLVKQHIYIADQSVKEKEAVVKEFGNQEDITIVHMQALCSGYAVDYIMKNIDVKSEYICTLDCDAFPIHNDWLIWPIELVDKGWNFVGGLFFESNGETIYPNEKFFCLTQCYRVGKTEDYKKLAANGGFARFNVRDRGGIDYLSTDWKDWGGNGDSWSDDAVIAHYWEDKHCKHNKIGLPITHAMGRGQGDSDWGAIIDGMVFHLGYSHWSNTIEDRVGKTYGWWKTKLNNGEDVITEMVNIASNHPTGAKAIRWSGEEKRRIYDI